MSNGVEMPNRFLEEKLVLSSVLIPNQASTAYWESIQVQEVYADVKEEFVSEDGICVGGKRFFRFYQLWVRGFGVACQREVRDTDREIRRETEQTERLLHTNRETAGAVTGATKHISISSLPPLSARLLTDLCKERSIQEAV